MPTTNRKQSSAKRSSPKKSSSPKEKLIGKVTHYFSKIKVVIIKLSGPLAGGDKIRIAGGDTDFVQQVQSMEVDHKKIKRAKARTTIGLRIKKKAREGYKVYKIAKS